MKPFAGLEPQVLPWSTGLVSAGKTVLKFLFETYVYSICILSKYQTILKGTAKYNLQINVPYIQCPLIIFPLISGSSLITRAKGSIRYTERVGLSGQTWQHPFFKLIDWHSRPLILLLPVCDAYIDLLHCTDLLSVPNCSSTWEKTLISVAPISSLITWSTTCSVVLFIIDFI